MSRSSKNSPIPWGALFFSLLGLAWCGYISFPSGNSAPCITSGCAIIRDGKIAGISLWWIGGAYFFTLAILCLRGARFLAWRISRVALFLDSILLLVMYFTGPCADCLIVAAFFALTCFTLRPPAGGWFLDGPSSPLLLPIWLGLFLGNACIAANEAIPPIVMGNAANKEVRLYFSPSCPSCREALLTTLGRDAALYPVHEKDGDTDAILRLKSFLEAGLPMSEALTRSLDAKEPVPDISTGKRLVLELQLLRNKAAVLRQGFDAMPLIEINGMPSAARTGSSQTTPALGSGFDPAVPVEGGMTPRNSQSGVHGEPLGTGLPDFLRDTTDLGRCPQGSTDPCDD